jgi:hydrogenase assembly chaperone HypC/HupF
MNIQEGKLQAPAGETPKKLEILGGSGALCELDAEGHCITCSDEALPATVLHVDEESGSALVEINEETEEVDITLVDEVAPGDLLLVHGGVAIAHLDR